MADRLLLDPRIRAIAWQDLLPLSPFEVLRELCLPLPWLLGSWWLAHEGWMLPALACSFVFFLCGLRVVHNGYHFALGLPRAWTEGVLFGMSLLMLGAMHAVQFNHLRHHQHCLGEEDVEAMSARMSGWQAIAMGPLFPVLLHSTALKLGGRTVRLWVLAELALNLLAVGAVLWLWPQGFLLYHFGAMGLGHCLTAFFAVWTVHHGCDGHEVVARTLRGRWKNLLSHNMFRHLEHHLFPAVPTCHLGQLSERLDEAAPELRRLQVF